LESKKVISDIDKKINHQYNAHVHNKSRTCPKKHPLIWCFSSTTEISYSAVPHFRRANPLYSNCSNAKNNSSNKTTRWTD